MAPSLTWAAPSSWSVLAEGSIIGLGVEGDDDDARIVALMAQEVRVPHADAASCASYYRNHPRQLTHGDMVEARHVLF